MHPSKSHALPALAIALLLGHNLTGDDYARARERIAALGRLTTPPAVFPAADFPDSAGIRALFFAGLPYRGRPTRVFAWYGAPAVRHGKVPGIVLVHGGGGTAYQEWVRKWNEHGFAAISIAVEGQTDQPSGTDARWLRHQWAGPARNGIYADSAEPLPDQWIFHAVAGTVLANSLLRSFPEVDAGRIGLMGISWGGVIAATVIGIDTRFAFAIPTYGCGALADVENQYGRALHENALYREVWDPLRWLPQARMPVLWFTWLHDVHFPLTAQSASYRAAPGPRMVAVLPDMKHSHPAGWNPPDSYAFAESVVSEGRPWLRQESQHLAADRAIVEFSTSRPLDRATLFSTADSGFTGSRKWTETAAALEQHGTRVRVVTSLPPGTRAWFVNVQSGSLTGSSDFVEESSHTPTSGETRSPR